MAAWSNARRGTSFEVISKPQGTAYSTSLLAKGEELTCPASAKTPSERGRRRQSLRQNPAPSDRLFRNSHQSEDRTAPDPHRTPRAGAHPFSSFEKTLQGREAVEESLYIRDKEAAAKYKREAELQAERLADASKAFKKEFSQELATMLHQKHLAERQKALRK